MDDMENRFSSEELILPASPLAQVFTCKTREDDAEVVIYAAVALEGPLPLDDFVSIIKEKVLTLRRFRSKIVKRNRSYDWIPVNVNVDDHIRIVELDTSKSEEGNCTNSAVEFGSQLLHVPLNMDRPPWEVYVLQNPNSSGGDKILFRLHHSLGDGISMASLFLDIVKTQNSTFATLPLRKKEENKKPLEFFFSNLKFFFNTVLSHARILYLLLSRDVVAGVKVTKSVRHEPRDLASVKFDIKVLKEIGKEVGATVNDVFVTLISAAMDKLLRAQVKEGGQVSLSHWSESDDLPKYRPHGVVIVNLRPPLSPSEIESMRKGEESPKWGTVAGYVIAKMPVNHVAGPLSRLLNVKREMDRLKHSAEATISKSGMDVIHTLFGPQVLLNFLNYIANQTTCTISNVAGPQEEVYLLGNRVKSVYQFADGLPNGAAFHLLGYADSAYLCISTHAATVSAELLGKFFSQSLEELQLAAAVANR